MSIRYPGITQGVTEIAPRLDGALVADNAGRCVSRSARARWRSDRQWISDRGVDRRPVRHHPALESGHVGGEQARLDGVLVEVWGHVSRPPRPAEPSEILVHGALVQPERPAISRWLRPGSNARRKASNISRMGSRSAGTASLRMEVPEKECRR